MKKKKKIAEFKLNYDEKKRVKINKIDMDKIIIVPDIKLCNKKFI